MKKLSEIGEELKAYDEYTNSSFYAPTEDSIVLTLSERRELVRAAITAWELFSENTPSVPEAELEEFLKEQGI